ncbi:MAG: isoprenyl transferase [Pirellula sp.]|jgi:undecaprenyl diphosphate synthase
MAFFGKKKTADSTNSASTLDSGRVPQHIAIIMDGNGRWAQSRGLPRIEGHRQGAKSVQTAIEFCAEHSIPFLTLYCFSNENWKRPKEELDFLMGLLKSYLTQQSESLVKNSIRLLIIGRRTGLPSDVLQVMDRAIEISKDGSKQTLCLAINYGSRQEIVDAVRGIASEVAAGRMSPSDIDEDCIERSLSTAGIPDPDLVIRTSGEMRLSNFLLWQISYSELWVTPKAWPEFGKSDLKEAIEEFGRRQRRFGGIDPTPTKSAT